MCCFWCLSPQEGKIEAEEFTSRLYKELNSSPQPYLVPFLKVKILKFNENVTQFMSFGTTQLYSN